MQISYASERGIGRVNEDYAICGSDWAALLDGATAMPGVESGCIHDVAWLVHRLSAAIATRMLGEPDRLDSVLAAAIGEVCDLHVKTCDLSNPDSPSTTVALARVTGDRLDYLVLGDSPVVLWHPDTVTQVFDDERIANLPGGRPYTRELVRSCRNAPGGFWVASTKPEAAYHAVTGTVELKAGAEVALFTDGVTRLVDFYCHSWDSLFELLRQQQPQGLIASVRKRERAQQPPYGKRHDDASTVHITSIEG
jgi:hypothetical protein